MKHVKQFFAVTSSYYDDGTVTAAITDSITAYEEPKSSQKRMKTKDIFVDWFGSEKEAKKFVQGCYEA